MKKYLLISSLSLIALPILAIAATTDFTADANITINNTVGGTGMMILTGSLAESWIYNGGAFTVTNPNVANPFKVASNSTNDASIRANDSGGTLVSCVNNSSPGSTYLTVPSVADTYTVFTSADACPSSTSSSGSSGGGGGGGSTPPSTPRPAAPVVVADCASGALFSSTTGRACSTTTNAVLPPQASPVATIALTRGLKLGTVGADVRDIQRFLNTHGFMISLSGAGSVGNETTYFGRATQVALLKFQIAQGIIKSEKEAGAGTVGPKTRALINSMLNTGTSASATVPVVAPVSQPAANPQTYQALLNLLRQLQSR